MDEGKGIGFYNKEIAEERGDMMMRRSRRREET
jgi:hypothetical protein